MSSNNELSALEKDLFTFTQDCNYDEVKRLLTEDNVFVDCVDADGMTPLQHAAYKGSYKLCKLFLDCGANVNLIRYVSRYSALTFAGLSGKSDVVLLLLEHGADVNSVNSINKTAAQMAAFVGNHHVVSIINNFIPLEEIHYFTKAQGLEKEPKLPLELCGIVHKMAIMININPVRLALYIQNNPCILENAKKVIRVFDILSEKQFKLEGNELLSLKFHHLSQVLSECEKFYKDCKTKQNASSNLPNKEVLNPLIKHWIKGDKETGFPITLEKFLREDVRKYPYVECSLFQQLIRTLAPTKVGEEPSAISIISEAVTGQRGADNSTACATCGDPSAESKCSACKSVQYCDRICQKLHWFTHKTICSLLKVNEETKKLNLECDSGDNVNAEDAGCNNKA